MIRMHSLMSRRSAPVWIAAALMVGLALSWALSGADRARADGHVTGTERLVVTPSEADFEPGNRSSETVVWIYGSGFTPGRELLVLIADQRGVATDVGALAGADVTVNADGAFGFAWQLGRFTRTGVGGEGAQSVRAVDAGTFDELATAPLALCNLSNRAQDDPATEDVDEGKPVPSHCSA